MTDKTDQRLRLTLRQLEVFAATARSGSTRAAADRVARSQSAASTALASLEAALDAPLFDRIGRRLLLNERGRALLPLTISLLDQAAELQSLFSREHLAPLRMAASFTIGEYLLPEMIALEAGASAGHGAARHRQQQRGDRGGGAFRRRHRLHRRAPAPSRRDRASLALR